MYLCQLSWVVSLTRPGPTKTQGAGHTWEIFWVGRPHRSLCSTSLPYLLLVSEPTSKVSPAHWSWGDTQSGNWTATGSLASPLLGELDHNSWGPLEPTLFDKHHFCSLKNPDWQSVLQIRNIRIPWQSTLLIELTKGQISNKEEQVPHCTHQLWGKREHTSVMLNICITEPGGCGARL